jgi:hypothetical protein
MRTTKLPFERYTYTPILASTKHTLNKQTTQACRTSTIQHSSILAETQLRKLTHAMSFSRKNVSSARKIGEQVRYTYDMCVCGERERERERESERARQYAHDVL